MGMHIGQLPFDRNRLFVVALFRVLCHHERASLPGNTWSLTPTMAKEALFLILKLLQIPQDATPAFGNAGHTQIDSPLRDCGAGVENAFIRSELVAGQQL